MEFFLLYTIDLPDKKNSEKKNNIKLLIFEHVGLGLGQCMDIVSMINK